MIRIPGEPLCTENIPMMRGWGVRQLKLDLTLIIGFAQPQRELLVDSRVFIPQNKEIMFLSSVNAKG